jgi:hypothetical protein
MRKAVYAGRSWPILRGMSSVPFSPHSTCRQVVYLDLAGNSTAPKIGIRESLAISIRATLCASPLASVPPPEGPGARQSTAQPGHTV